MKIKSALKAEWKPISVVAAPSRAPARAYTRGMSEGDSSSPVLDSRQAIEDGRLAMKEALSQGASGTDACRGLSDVYDAIVRSLWTQALKEIPAMSSCNLALIATGGWGRRELCPYSDIDFILLAARSHEEVARVVADRLLYPLWDAKAKVGHALRSAKEAARLAKDDLPTATSLLDARLVVGSEDEFRSLMRATREAVVPGGNCNAFVNSLLIERRRRHERFGDSLYLLEPNIKQGIGALRDYSTAHWAARARWSVAQLSDLVGLGELTRRQAQVLDHGLNYLLKLRCLVQLEAGRGTDQLSFEIQENIGPMVFPYVTVAESDLRPAVAPAVETLMRKYYLSGRGIERVAERILESAMIPARRRPRITHIDGSFLIWNGKLAVRDPGIFSERPEEMLRYFRVAQEYEVPLYGHTKELIEAEVAENANLRLAKDPVATRYFLAALTDLADSGEKPLLREMHSVGLLAAVMPEFGPCTGRTQHDLYHVYTVDYHQLYAIGLLKKTGRGELDVSGATAMEAYQLVKGIDALYLALLLHDVGKPWGSGHAETGADIAAGIATRLGFEESEVEKVDFLVRQHLAMSHISQRRDLSDPDVISKFAELVGDVETLAQLFLVTRCDTAMTAPGNLSSWKDQLMSELYVRTRDHLTGFVAMESEQALHRRQARQEAVEIVSLQGEDIHRAARAQTFTDRIDASFVNHLSAEQLSRVIDTAIIRVDEGKQIVSAARMLPEKEQSELIVVSEESPAILSHVAGVLAAHRVTIDSAAVCSVEAPGGDVALQIFYVRDGAGQAIDTGASRWSRIQRDLEKVLASETRSKSVQELIDNRDSGYSVEPTITTRGDVHIDVLDGESSDYSVLEVCTIDSAGLLHCITKVLADQELDIHRSMIATEGDRVVDTFYLRRSSNGAKLDTEQAAVLQDVLHQALDGLGEAE